MTGHYKTRLNSREAAIRSNHDIVVVGGGNAALCAAIVAREAGARVLVLEAAPKAFRGGNSRHVRSFRCMHGAPEGTLAGVYGYGEYLADLLEIVEFGADEALARLVVRRSEECYHWMEARGVRFQPPLSGTVGLGRTNAFFLGGGKALLNAYYRTAGAVGVDVLYDAPVAHLEFDGTRIARLDATVGGEPRSFSPRAVIVASGGCQADAALLAETWGAAAENFVIRGTPFNRGAVLRDLLDQGVASVGDPKRLHAVAVDARAPKSDGGAVTRVDCVPFSIVVDRDAERFRDEGEDIWPKRYDVWGGYVAERPGQIAWAIGDADIRGLFMPSLFPPAEAGTVGELAAKLGLPPDRLTATVERFNAACRPGDFAPTRLDGLATEGLTPPKSNWARPIAKPPFFGYALRPGVTFASPGLGVDKSARVQGPGGPIENLWAAGEIMVGSILGRGCLAGVGMAVGTVFGRIAGKEAAAHVA